MNVPPTPSSAFATSPIATVAQLNQLSGAAEGKTLISNPANKPQVQESTKVMISQQAAEMQRRENANPVLASVPSLTAHNTAPGGLSVYA